MLYAIIVQVGVPLAGEVFQVRTGFICKKDIVSIQECPWVNINCRCVKSMNRSGDSAKP